MIAGLARWRVLGLLLFIALAEALGIVALPYFATADGPTHIADAVTLTQYGSPGHAVYSHYYTLSYFPVPNLSTVLLLVALVRLVSPNVAEKIMICGYIFGLPLALLYAVRSVRLDSGWPAFLAFPLPSRSPCRSACTISRTAS